LERTLAANLNAPAFVRAKALNSAGKLAALQGDMKRFKALCDEALTIAHANNDRWNMGWALHNYGFHIFYDVHQSAATLDESLALFRELDDPLGLSHALYSRAYRALDQ